MATAYWCGGDSGNETDIDVAANYVDSANGTTPFGSVPDSDDHVIFQSLALSNVSHNCTINANIEFYSIKTEAGSTLTGNASYTITVVNETSDYATKIDGTMASTPNFTINTTVDTRVDVSDGGPAGTVTFLGEGNKQLRGTPTITNFIINHASSDNDTSGAVTITGDFTITAGIFDTGADHALTVEGTTLIDTNGTLTCNDSTCQFGATSYTAGRGLDCNGLSPGATFNGGGGTHTYSSIRLAADSNIDFTPTTGSATITAEADNRAFYMANGTVTGGGTYSLIIATPTDTAGNLLSDTSFTNITFTPSSGTPTHELAGDGLKCTNLIINAGATVDTTSGTNGPLVITEGVSGAGTLTTNASAISFGYLIMTGTYNATTDSSGTILTSRSGPGAQLLMDVGKIVHNNGYFVFKGAAGGDSYIGLNGASDATNGFYNVEIHASGRTINISAYNLSIHNNLYVTIGTLDTTTYDLTVTGETQITGTLTCNDSAISLGAALTSGWGFQINSGGTFNGGGGTHTIGSIRVVTYGTRTVTLTSDVTNITSKNTSNGYTINLSTGATFNHGGGSVILTYDGDTNIALDGATLAFNDLTYNAAARTLTLEGPISCAGYLKILAGTLDTKSAENNALTVEEYTQVSLSAAADYAILATNDSVCQFGATSYTAEYGLLVKQGGTVTCGTASAAWTASSIWTAGTYTTLTFTRGTCTVTSQVGSGLNSSLDFNGDIIHNSGTLTITTAATTTLDLVPSNTAGINNLIINHASCVAKLVGGGPTGNNAIEGYLTVTAGTFNCNNVAVEVDGDVSVTGTFDAHTEGDQAVTFGSLTINGTGRYLATSGTTTLLGNFNNSGTFTHNSGKVKFSNTNDADVAINNTGTVEPVFYNLSNALETTGRLDAQDDITVINILDLCDGITTRSTIIGANVVLTMGNDSQSGYIRSTTASKPLQTGTDCIIQGANVLYPAIIESSVDLEYIAYFSNCSLKWIDIQQDWTTAGQGRTITLTGDCEFDAVTVTNGDALDLNGQRIETSGVLTIAALSSIDTPTNSLMVLGGAIDYDGSGWANGNKVDIMFTGAGATNDFAGQDYKTIMFNGTGENALNWATYFGTTNFIVASDFTPGHDFRCTDLTIATGATFDADVDEHQIAGDFNIAGGLIGKSAYSSDGAAANYGTGTGADLSSTTGPFTIEQWVKRADYSTVEKQLCQLNGLQVYFSAGGLLRIKEGTNSTMQDSTDTNVNFSTLGDNKWYHIAIVYDASASRKRRVFVDSKEYALTNSTDTITLGNVNDYYIGRYFGDTNYNLDGQIGYLRIWDEARTVTEIRANMFKRTPTDSNSKCKINLVFDEGTGVDVDNIGTELAAGDGTLNVGGTTLWAGAGTFTQGTSTVDLTGTGELILKSTVGFYNLKCAAATETTTVRGLGSITIGIKNNIYVGDGTLTRTGGSPSWRFAYDTTDGSSQTLGGTVVSGATYPVNLSNTYVNYYHDITLVKEVKWNYFLGVRGCTFSADQESTGYTSWDGGSATYDYGNYTLKADHAKFGGSNGTVNFDAGKLWLTNTIGLTASTASDNFTCGPGGTVSGSSAATTFKSQNDWAVVGRIENLNVTNEELNVTGQVINCTGEIHQWHPALDDAQQLDRDTAEDRDINLGRDLDKNTELVG